MIAINTNVNALASFNYSRLSSLEFVEKTNRLTSGNQLTTGAVDPSGLAISQSMKAHIRGLSAAIVNAEDTQNLLRTVDSFLNTTQDIMMKMRDLSVKLANASVVDNDVSGDPANPQAPAGDQALYLYQEIELMKDHIYRAFTIQETTNPYDIIPAPLNFNGKNIFDTIGLNSGLQSGFGGTGQATQIGPDGEVSNKIDIILNDISEMLQGYATPYDPPMPADSTQQAWFTGYARNQLDVLTDNLDKISTVRAQAGTMDISLEHTIEDLNADLINASAAKSRIADADFAKEIVGLTKNQILSQTAQIAQSQIFAEPEITIPLLQAIYDGLMPALVGFGAKGE